jgi:hypothetical protein
MRTVLTLLTFLVLTVPCIAYPLFPGQKPSEFVRERTKPGFVLYQAQEDKEFQGYGRERPKADTLTDYDQPRNGSTFSDFQQRTRDKKAFDLYNQVEETYEKEPRFRY